MRAEPAGVRPRRLARRRARHAVRRRLAPGRGLRAPGGGDGRAAAEPADQPAAPARQEPVRVGLLDDLVVGVPAGDAVAVQLLRRQPQHPRLAQVPADPALALVPGPAGATASASSATRTPRPASRTTAPAAASPPASAGPPPARAGTVVVVDDPHNVKEKDSAAKVEATLAWWDEVMSTRLNDPKTGAKVIVMQRVAENDLSGHVLKQGGYEHLCLPAEFEPGRRCVTVAGLVRPAPPGGRAALAGARSGRRRSRTSSCGSARSATPGSSSSGPPRPAAARFKTRMVPLLHDRRRTASPTVLHAPGAACPEGRRRRAGATASA